MSRYLVSEQWEHLDKNNRHYSVRWAYDYQAGAIYAQVKYKQVWDWQNPGAETIDDLYDHLILSNQVHLSPQDWDEVELTDTLPAWATVENKG